VMLFGCLLLACGVKAAVYTDADDILNGGGDFENDGGMGIWAAWSSNGSQPISIDSTYVNTVNGGSYSMKLGPSTDTKKNIRVVTEGLSLVANRYYSAVAYARFASGRSPSWGKVILAGQDSTNSTITVSSTVSWGNGYFKENNLSLYYTGVTTTTGQLQLAIYTNSSNNSLWWDDVALYQEVALPEVGAILGSGTTWTLTNEGGRTADETAQLIAFDPDVTVSYLSGFNVGEIAATWTSDNQLDLTFANSLAVGDTVTLLITNPNGNATYAVTIPEPATIAILGFGLLGIVRKRN